MEKKKWLKITIKCEPQLVDPLSDFLVGIVGAGVETGAPDEPHFGILQAYVEQPDQNGQGESDIVKMISGQLRHLAGIFDVAVPVMECEVLEDQDWGKEWKEHFKPFSIVPGLVIVPSWEQYECAPGERTIVMDPGMAFGTGHHATTTLCLELLQEISIAGGLGRVLDVGTGTGILAMAACIFGASSALGIDNDQDAVDAAADNVAQNKLQSSIRIGIDPLTSVTGEFDTVVANIISSVLQEMSQDLVRSLASGGKLILSGILAGEQEQQVISVFTAIGLKLLAKRHGKEWVALLFEKE